MLQSPTIVRLFLAACFLGASVASAWASAERDTASTRKGTKRTGTTVVIPSPPGVPPRAVVVQSESGRVLRLTQDSIYAQEISIDASGIRIVDRDGMEIILPAYPFGQFKTPEVPDMPKFPEFDIVIESSDDIKIIERHGGGVDQITQMASNIDVRADEVVRGDVVCIFCDVQVSGTVTGSAVSIFGNVNVDGLVGGEAIAPFGRIHVGPEGNVRSDAFASKIVREPGGRIGGSRQEMFFNIFGGDEAFGEAWTRQTFTVVVILKILFWLFLVLLAHALAARNIQKVKARIQKSYAKSFLMGILGQILLIPVFLLLLVTIIGIPVALFVLPLMLFAGLVLAQAAVGQIVGEKIAENTSLPLRTVLSQTITGVAALQIFAYLTIVFIWPAGHGSSGGAFRLITIIMFVLSAIMGYVVMTLGTGAVILTRFGTRPREAVEAIGIPSEPECPVPPDLAHITPLPFEPRPSGESGTNPATSP